MPVDPIMPQVFVQDMGPTARLVHDASVRPDVAQAMAKIMTEETLREENKQIQKSQPNEQSGDINTEDGGGGRGTYQENNQTREGNEDALPTDSGDPFVGKLVNRKI